MMAVERLSLDLEKIVYKMHSQDGPTARPAYPGEKPWSLLRSPINPAWFGDFVLGTLLNPRACSVTFST